jgi:hypothetical protein
MRKIRLCIDFNDAASAAEFVNRAKELDLLPEPVGAFKINALDRAPRSGGIGFKDTFLLAADGDPNERLVVEREEVV